MKSVIKILDHLGYDEVRFHDGHWKPLSEANGRLGTTDETSVIKEDQPPQIRLRDAETGEEIGRARAGSPVAESRPAPEEE